MSAEAEIRELVEARVRAVAAKDAKAATAHHAQDITMFDVVPPLRYAGRDEVRRRTAEWFAAYDGPIGYEVRDLAVMTGGDLAFCRYLYRVSGQMTNGSAVTMWVRATLCFQRAGAAWQLVHEHDSVPFDPETGKAALDLEPD